MAQPEPQETLQAYVRIQRAADAEILRALKQAYKDVNAQLGRMARSGASEMDRARALAIKQSILLAQAEVFERTGKIIERRRVEAAARAIQVSGRYDEVAFAAVGRERDARAVAEGLEATEARAIDAVEARLSGASRILLSQRVYRTRDWSSGMLERRINSALARGLNAQQFAREIQPLVNPNTPGGPRYAALRLARTEINNAYHAMAVRAAQAKPWVKKVEWHLSKSHPKVPGKVEVCETLAGRMFSPEEVPLKPHPQCMCYITPVVDADDDAFLDDLVGGAFDDFLDEFAEQHGLEAGPAFGNTNPVREGTDVTPELATPEEIAPAPPETQRLAPGTPASARTDEWLAENLDPRVADAARTAYDACNEQVPRQASFRIRSVSTYNRRTTPQHFHRSMDGGAYASCSGGHIVVQGSLAENRKKIKDALKSGRFIKHRKLPDELVYTLAHEMGHALTVGRLNSEEQTKLVDLVGDIMGWDRTHLDAFAGLGIDDIMTVMLSEKPDRDAFEAKFGRYAASNADEFIAEVWSVFVLDPEECDPDIQRIGKLLAGFIDDVPVIDDKMMAELAAKYKAMYGEDLT